MALGGWIFDTAPTENTFYVAVLLFGIGGVMVAAGTIGWGVALGLEADEERRELQALADDSDDLT